VSAPRPLRRLASALLPERSVDLARILWHRSQVLSPRRLWLHRAFRRLNADAAADEIVLRPGLRLAIDPQAREPFEWFCFRSPEMARELDGFLARSTSCRRLLDVGACHGLFSLAFTRRNADAAAVAIEPSPLAWEVLTANLRGNPGARVTPVQAAMGAAPGTLRMRFSWHHLEAAPATSHEDEPGTVSLPVRTLDDLSSEISFRPDALKIDVEGYETFVVQGARRILREDHPVLFLEIHPAPIERLGGTLAGLWDLLAEHGYQVHDLADRPLSRAQFTGFDTTVRVTCL
jgi:FkbM family methyltransferase